MAEGTNFLVAHDEHGFVFPDFGFAGDFQRALRRQAYGGQARVQVWGLCVAGEEDEVHVAVAPGI